MYGCRTNGEEMRTGNDKTRVSVKRLGFVGERVGYLLHRVDMLHMQLIREELAEIGLTPARATALAFVNANAKCRQKDLGQALGINRSSTMEIVNALVSLNALERRVAIDRRTNMLVLTPQGQRLFEQFSAISKEVDTTITTSFSSDDHIKLLGLMGRITSNLENALEPERTEITKAKLFAVH